MTLRYFLCLCAIGAACLAVPAHAGDLGLTHIEPLIVPEPIESTLPVVDEVVIPAEEVAAEPAPAVAAEPATPSYSYGDNNTDSGEGGE
ncbi:MAG: hypothetical protein EP349_00070 [Alphaproteobacteria bacterium]|nr:MAG: hypothetical protein EP349_00070 [Alphaproteobacteria bacterium]